MATLRVGDAMQPVRKVLREDTTLDDVIQRLSNNGADGIPVVDRHGVFLGTVTQKQAEQAARKDKHEVTAAELAVRMPTIRADQYLDEAVGILVRHEGSGLPVLASGGRQVVGWLSHRDVLRAYGQHSEVPRSRVAARWPDRRRA